MNVVAGTMGGITAITSGMSALTSSFGAIGTEAAQTFGTLDGLLVTSTALIGTFALKSAEAFGEYEQGMKIVQAVSGQTGSAMNELTSKATEMSVAYRTSIGDITEGLQTLGRAGLNSASEQLDVLESGLQTAKLEGRSLNGVLEELIQNTTMLGGDLKSVNFGDQSEYVNTLLVGTSMTAPIDSHDISQTLQYAGGTAAAAGANITGEEEKKKLEDLMGTIAAFAQKGVTGSIAGTALRSFFTKPASQDKTVTEGLSMLGLTPDDLWEDGGESMKSVSDQIGIIQRQMDSLNLSTMDQVEIWGKIVGPKMGQQMMKLDSSSIKELTRDIQSAQSAEDLATQTLQTYNQKLSEVQQKGEVVYRDLGEKMAMWLTPAVEVVSKFLDLLSNPAVNTIVFVGLGATLAHGVRKAYSMLQVLYGQIKGMISDTIAGIENINNLAGGSASGFAQGASQAEFLNSKLKETDATLQAIQAKSMGIRPGYQLPGGLYTDMVPKRTFNAYEEDIIIDKRNLMGKGSGIFSGENRDFFIQSVDEYAEKLKMDYEEAQNELDQDIKQAKSRVKDIHTQRDKEVEGQLKTEIEKLDKELDEKVKAAKLKKREAIKEIKALQEDTAGMITWKKSGVPIDVQKEALNSPDFLEAQSMYGPYSDEAKKALAPYIAESKYKDLDPKNLVADTSEIDQEIKQAKEDHKKAVTRAKIDIGNAVNDAMKKEMDEAYAELKELESMEIEDNTLSRDDIKAIKEEAFSQARTELKLFDEYEFEEWKKRQKGRGDLGEYSLDRAAKFYDEDGEVNRKSTVGKQYGEELQALHDRGFYVIPESNEIPESEPNAQLLGQSLNKNILNEMADAREQIIDRQKKELLGQTGIKRFSQEAYEIGAQRLSVFSRGLDRARNSITNFSTKIQDRKIEADISRQARGRGREFWTGDYTNILGKQIEAQNILGSKGFLAENEGQNVKTVASNLRKEMQLTSTEFGALLNNSKQFSEILGYDTEIAERLGDVGESLREEIAMVVTAEKEKQVTDKESIAAERSEIMANLQAAASEEMENAANQGSALSSVLGGLQKGAGSVVGMLGGPLMAGMMGITIGMQLIQASQQQWQEQMQKASEQVSESMDQMSEAQENIKQLYSSENNSISEADLSKAVDQQYASIYDSFYTGKEDRSSLGYATFDKDVDLTGPTDKETKEYRSLNEKEIAARNAEVEEITLSKEENVKALKENTMELVAATAAYNQGIARQSESFRDDTWGFNGVASNFTDWLGEQQELIWNGGRGYDTHVDNREGFLDSHAPVLTGSQSDSNYAGSTEFAGIFAADSYRFRNDSYDEEDPRRYTRSLEQFFGSDYDRIIGLLGSINGRISNEYGSNINASSALYTNSRNMEEMNPRDFAIAQMALKNDQGTFQQLGKQMFRYEQSRGFRSGRTAYADAPQLKKALSGDRKAFEKLGRRKLSVQDKNLVTTLKRLLGTTNNSLSEQNLLAMGQLQQLQDMYTVANETVAPGITQTVQGVYNNVNATGAAANQAEGAKTGAISAANNAASIAAVLGAEAQSTAEKTAFQEYTRKGGKYKTQEEFVSAVARGELPEYEEKILKSLLGTSWSLTNGDSNPDNVEKNANRLYGDLDNMSGDYQDKLNTAVWGILQYSQKATMAAYDQSTLGEYGSGSRSTGSGSGSSGGDSDSSSNKNKDKTNVRNRVDLVLCNKKTIPKLNVNLFKKAPSFTVLNKNFKVRDIKINTQDKPKAMMNAIKNGIIDVQRRVDPKIIQDDEAVYDPVAGTEGDNLPRGSTLTTT